MNTATHSRSDLKTEIQNKNYETFVSKHFEDAAHKGLTLVECIYDPLPTQTSSKSKVFAAIAFIAIVASLLFPKTIQNDSTDQSEIAAHRSHVFTPNVIFTMNRLSHDRQFLNALNKSDNLK